MPAETLNCPMCGAPASSEATRCDHCGARLATVACPSCFGVIFAGSKFCSHCGAKVDRVELSESAKRLCPRCAVGMEAVAIGKTHLLECSRCEGLWADADSLQEICADREDQAAVLGMAAPVAEEASELETKIRYLPCPVCRKLMNRVNFAHCSHVVVDVCTVHGTWFDKDELRRIVEFIRGGGLDRARAQEITELEEERRKLSNARLTTPWEGMDSNPSFNLDRQNGLSAAASMLKSLLGY